MLEYKSTLSSFQTHRAKSKVGSKCKVGELHSARIPARFELRERHSFSNLRLESAALQRFSLQILYQNLEVHFYNKTLFIQTSNIYLTNPSDNRSNLLINSKQETANIRVSSVVTVDAWFFSTRDRMVAKKKRTRHNAHFFSCDRHRWKFLTQNFDHDMPLHKQLGRRRRWNFHAGAHGHTIQKSRSWWRCEKKPSFSKQDILRTSLPTPGLLMLQRVMASNEVSF